MTAQRATPTTRLPDEEPTSSTRDRLRTEDALRRAALTRLEDRAGLRAHLLTYVLVNLVVVGVWALSGGGSFWPFYPLAGWGIGLALHAYSVWSGTPTTAQVRAELERMTR